MTVGLQDVLDAARRIEDCAHRTPVLRSTYFSERVGAELFFKCENFQKVGAFKFRGACNAVMSLSDAEAGRGVVTHSSGNHAQALALAARMRGIPADIVMPRTAPAVKQAAVRDYGATVHLCEPTLEAREAEAARVLSFTGGTLIHPYDDDRIIAGAGTAALELHEDVPGLDFVLVPVGGGGLLSGTAITTVGVAPSCKVVAGEPKGAGDAKRSFDSGVLQPSVNPNTIADGLLTSLSERTFAIIKKHVTDIVTVDDDAIREAMVGVWERMKIVIEPSAAVPLAVLLTGGLDVTGAKVGVILSGGNVGFPFA